MPVLLMSKIKHIIKEKLRKSPKLWWLISYFRKLVESLREKDYLNFVKAKTYLEIGKSLTQQGQLQEAIECYQKVCVLMPDEWAEAHLSIGYVFAQQNQLGEAIESYKRALVLAPNGAVAHFFMGNALLGQGKLAEAIQEYQQAITLKFDSAQLRFNLGNALAHTGQLEEAIQQYERAVDLAPDSVDVQYTLGKALAQKGQIEDAIERYQQALTLKPDWAELYFHLGTALVQQNRPEAALQHFQQGIALMPDSAEAYLYVGCLLAQKGQLTEAVESYQQALTLKPDWPDPYFHMGTALVQQEQWEAAVESYRQAIILKPNWAEAHFYVGYLLAQQDQLEEAINSYEQAITNKPDWVELYFHLGTVLRRQERLDAAIESYQKAIALKPNWVAAHLCVGHLLAQQGQWEEAKKSYQQAITINLDWAKVYFHLGTALAGQGNLTAAIRAYQRALKLKPDWAEAHLFTGYLLAKQGQLEAASQSYQQALKFKPDWTRVYPSVESLLTQQNQLQEAIQSYQQSIPLEPERAEDQVHIDMDEAFIGNRLIIQGKPDEAVSSYQRLIEVQNQLTEVHQLNELGIRLLSAHWVTRIGHIALLDAYVKAGILGWQQPQTTIVLAPPDLVANPCLLNYWSRYVHVISDPFLIQCLSPLVRYLQEYCMVWRLSSDQSMFVHHAASEVQKQWEAEGREPLLTLSAEDSERGFHCLQKLGVPQDAWFVCLHVRESGFHKEGNNTLNAYRDAEIETYFLAVQSIVERGGWVIRMGDPSMRPLPPMPQVIDYAHSELRSDWMDVFCCTQCHFLVGVTSGLHHVPSSFGVPCVLTNYVAMASRPAPKDDIYIPKLYWSVPEERYLSFAEAMSPPFGYTQSGNVLVSSGIRVVNNTPEEINEVVIEMLERLAGTLEYTQEDEHIQERFHALASMYNSYGSGSSRIGQIFLRRYAELLPAVGEESKTYKSLSTASPS